MTEPHILVVDDDQRLRELLHDYLTRQGFFVLTAADAAEAEIKLQWFRFDAMVLDRMMPGESGVSFMSRLTVTEMPVLMLTAMGEASQRIEGLEAGARDYLAKPFEPKELVLRLNNLLTRREQKQQPVQFGPFQFHPATGTLTQSGKPIYLTALEAAYLLALVEAKGKSVSRETLARSAGDQTINGRSVDVQINRLRKKIEPNPARPIYIQTIRGEGYVLKVS